MRHDKVDSHGPEQLSRRSTLQAAAWSTPALVVALAAPSASASTSNPIVVDLHSTAHIPNEAPNGTHLGYSYYQGARTLTFTFQFGNNGPDELPAGGLVTIGLPFAAIWDTGSMAVIADPNSKMPTAAGTGTMDITADGGPSAFRRLWYFSLGAPVPAGSSFSLTFSVNLTATSNSASNFYRVRPYSDIGIGITSATDFDTSNNADTSDQYVFFNNQNAS